MQDTAGSLDDSLSVKSYHLPQEILDAIVDARLYSEFQRASKKFTPKIFGHHNAEKLDFDVPRDGWTLKHETAFDKFEPYIKEILQFRSTSKAIRSQVAYNVRKQYVQVEKDLEELDALCRKSARRTRGISEEWREKLTSTPTETTISDHTRRFREECNHFDVTMQGYLQVCNDHTMLTWILKNLDGGEPIQDRSVGEVTSVVNELDLQDDS